MLNKKRIFACTMATMMLLSNQSVYAEISKGDFSDFPTNWSAQAMEQAVKNGLLSGMGDGTIQPNGNVTRAQMAAMIDRAFGAKDTAKLNAFGDVKHDAWYYDSMAKAVHMGVLFGGDGQLRPNDPVSREEAFAILSRVFSMDAGNLAALQGFADNAKIADWAKGSLAAMVEAGYVHGANGNINAKSNITRAEFAQIMNNMVGTYITETNVHSLSEQQGKGDVIEGNVVVRDNHVNLNGVTIRGNLIIADGAEHMNLDGVTVTGSILVRGGNQGIEIKNATAKNIIVANPTKKAAISIQESKVPQIITKGDVKLDGNVDSIVVVKPADVTIHSGVVNYVVISKEAEGTKLSAQKGAEVSDVKINADHVAVAGDGKVEKVEVSGSHVSVDTPNTEVSVSKDAQDVTAGKEKVQSGDSKKTEQNTQEKPNTGGSSGGGGGSSGSSGGGGGSSSGGSSGGGGSKPEAISLIDVKNTKLVHLYKGGMLQYVVVQFTQGNGIKNCTLSVDGTDITNAVSNVTDDGSIVKWEVTDLNPAKLTVRGNGKTETVKLSDNLYPTTPVLPTEATAPDYFLLNGPIYVWDYHLTNYDDSGKVRVMPKATTFDLNERKELPIASYRPDAVLKEDPNADNIYGVSGQVEIMFNYEKGTAEERAFVDGISNVALVAYNENKQTLNDNLTYTKNTNVTHNANTVASITVPLGQKNFYSNGRYYLRITSNEKSYLFPIHVVNEVVPEITLAAGEGASGQEVHFIIQNMTYGITSPVYRVDLKDADGKIHTLKKYDDWFLHGNRLVLYNDHTNYFAKDGNYQVTVYADGFQKFSTPLFHHAAIPSEKPVEEVKITKTALQYDAISTASVGGGSSGGGSSEGGDGRVMNGNLIVDADLMANAQILTELGLANDFAKGVADRWDMNKLYVFHEGAEAVYDVNDYFNDVSVAQAEGEYLTFTEYARGEGHNGAVQTPNRPAAVKHVLEDNLLGLTTSFREAVNKDVLDLNVSVDGTTATITADDPNYFTDATFYMNGSLTPMKPGAYTVDGNTMTIADLEKGKTYTLHIQKKGYLTKEVTFSVERPKEDVTFSAPAVKNNESIVVTCDVAHTEGNCDFFAHLKGVKMIAPDGKERIIHKGDTESTLVENGYTVANNKLTIGKDIFKEAVFKGQVGTYKIIILSDGYAEQTVTVEVTKGDEIVPEMPDTEITAPTEGRVEKYAGNYVLSFKEANTAFMNAITSVRVNDVVYQMTTNPLGILSENTYSLEKDVSYARVHMHQNAFKNSQENTIVIQAGDQVRFTKTITLDAKGNIATGTLKPDGPEPSVVTPEGTVTKRSKDGTLYDVTFAGDDVRAYLNKISVVQVDGTSYTKGSDIELKNTNQYYTDNMTQKLSLNVGDLAEGKHNVVIQATGYQDQTVVLTVPKAEEAKEKDVPRYAIGMDSQNYKLVFDRTYVDAITAVSVEGQSYTLQQFEGYFPPALKDKEYKKTTDTLILHPSAFQKGNKNTVTIQAKGYKEATISIVLTEDGSIKPTLPIVQKMTSTTISYGFSPSGTVEGYRVIFQDPAFASPYLRNIQEIKVTSEEDSSVTVIPLIGMFESSQPVKKYVLSDGGENIGNTQIDFTADCFGNGTGTFTVTITAKASSHYDALTFKVVNGKIQK